MPSQHAYNYIHCMYSAMYVSAKPRSVISGLWCVVLLYIPSHVDTVGLSVDCSDAFESSDQHRLYYYFLTLLLSMLNVCCSCSVYKFLKPDIYDVHPTMGPNNLKHSTNLQKLK